MILRRVIYHFKKQEWTAIALDFVIVVLGVFVGLQVNNWNEGQVERRAYLNALDRLRGEIAADFDMLDLAEADVKAELPVVRAAYDALETCADEPQTLQKVNAGLKLISGSNGVRLRKSELAELTSSSPLLSQQPPAIRRRLSDLLFYTELVLSAGEQFEHYPRETRPERISVLRPGARTRQDTTYLGIEISEDRRPLELKAPVSVACGDPDLVAALWAWDRSQGNLFMLLKKMRQEYQSTLDLLDQEHSR